MELLDTEGGLSRNSALFIGCAFSAPKYTLYQFHCWRRYDKVMDTTLCALSPPSCDECALRCGELFELAIAIVCLLKTPLSLALLNKTVTLFC